MVSVGIKVIGGTKESKETEGTKESKKTEEIEGLVWQ